MTDQNPFDDPSGLDCHSPETARRIRSLAMQDTLHGLMREAETATATMSVRNPNRALMLRLCAYALGVTGEMSQWQQRLRRAVESCRADGQSGKEHLYLTYDEIRWALQQDVATDALPRT